MRALVLTAIVALALGHFAAQAIANAAATVAQAQDIGL